MQIGVQAPYFADDPIAVRDFVQTLDGLGFDSIWLPEHIVVPASLESSYPYDLPSPDRLFKDKRFLSAIVTAGFIAGMNTRLTVGFGVLLIPLRNPVELAKQLATIDVLSGGHLIVGAGAGWLEEEFRALGAPFDSRGARFDEGVRVMRCLWGKQPASFGGRFWSFDELYCEPLPRQTGGPPIWIGGHSAAALRRCAQLGDGWYSVELSPAQFREKNAALDALLSSNGRHPHEVRRSASTRLRLSDNSQLEETARLVTAFQEAECDHLVVSLTATQTVEANIKRMRTLAEKVLVGLQRRTR